MKESLDIQADNSDSHTFRLDNEETCIRDGQTGYLQKQDNQFGEPDEKSNPNRLSKSEDKQ